VSPTPVPILLVVNDAPQPEPRPRFDHHRWTDLTPVEQTIQPTHQVAFPGAHYITAAAFAPDGRTVYCLVDGKGVDLWAAGLSRWPELLGGCLGVVLLIYVLVVARVLRRAQVAGEPYCRRCNYNVVSQAPRSVKKGTERVAPEPGMLCPECGVDLSRRKPARGRSNRRRLWLPTSVLFVCVIAYVWLFLSGVPRSAKAPDAPQIWWRWVDALAERHQIDWLLKHRTAVSRLMTVDTGTGACTGCLRTSRTWEGTGYGIVAAPDGRHLAVAQSFNRLSWVNARTGWVVASTSGGEFRGGGNTESFVLAVEGPDDDPRVYYRAVDQKSMMSRLLEWHPKSGVQRVLVEEPAYIFTYANGTKAGFTRRYALIHRPNGIAIASAPDFSQAYQEKVYLVTVRGPATAANAPGDIERQILIPGGQSACSSPLLVNTDGSRLFVASFPDLLGYDANTGEQLGALRPKAPESANEDRILLSPTGGRLFVPVHPNAILVRDVARGAWTARLTVPEPFIAPTLWASTDNRWLAAAPFRDTGNKNEPYVSELFLYDLSPLDRAKDAPPR
jgi:hypothetical protein